MNQEANQPVDIAGVGIGPFNLSVAALVEPLKEFRSRFFERRPEFQWHPGLLFPDATIQVSYLKDLVTLADPTSRYSFISFLFENKRLYRFITANFPRATRQEFNQYLRWVCSSLSNLEFGRDVDAISYDGKSLVLDVGNERISTTNAILGTGLTPIIPECAKPHLGQTVFHASNYLKWNPPMKGRKVVVVGGGQTGAEVLSHILSNTDCLPSEAFWVSRRSNFLPLDDSPFINELFTPGYSDLFFTLNPEERESLLAEQKLTSDGISVDLLEKIYRRLYELDFLEGNGHRYGLYPGYELVQMDPASDGWLLTLKTKLRGHTERIHANVVVLCTGSEYRLPSFLAPLAGRIPWEAGGFRVRDDFSIEWDGPPGLRIYVQNAAKHCRGIADPNLSLMAWRSGTIINSLAGRCIYDVKEASTVFDWNRHMITEKARGYSK